MAQKMQRERKREMERKMGLIMERRIDRRMDFMDSLMHGVVRRDETKHQLTALERVERTAILFGLSVRYTKDDRLLHRDARKGEEEHVRKTLELLDQQDRPDLSITVTPQKNNTALHVAVTFQQLELARKIIKLCPALISQPNSKGDTPLHIAAKSGHFLLTQLLSSMTIRRRDLEEGTSRGPLGDTLKMKNLGGNNPFHEALRKGHEEAALCLLEWDAEHELGHIVNNAGESPLYLAAEAGLLRVVEKLIQGPDHCSIQGPDGQTPLHIAVMRSHFAIVLELLDCERIDPKQKDCYGKTALHYAASIQIQSGVDDWQQTNILGLLASTFRSLVYVCDNDGNSPLHILAIRGSVFHIHMAEFIVNTHPYAAELVDHKGRNVLHLAAMKGNLAMLMLLLKWQELKVLINEPDDGGNTPLHLAVKMDYYDIVKVLLKMGADANVANKNGLTALNICEFQREPSITQQNVLDLLIRSKATKGRLPMPEDPPFIPRVHFKENPKTKSVIATLVATVTFAGAFTLPGGFHNNAPDEGHPVFMKRAALKVFILSDAVAFLSSLTVVMLSSIKCEDNPFLNKKIMDLIGYLISVAVYGMTIAFTTALYVVLSDKSRVLATVVTCIGCSLPLLQVFAGTYLGIQLGTRTLVRPGLLVKMIQNRQLT